MDVEVLYNNTYGGFSLSKNCSERLNELKGKEVVAPDYGYIHNEDEIPRHDPDLVKAYKEFASEMSTIAIAVVTAGCYKIDEYDGWESVIEMDDIDWIYVDKNVYPEQFL